MSNTHITECTIDIKTWGEFVAKGAQHGSIRPLLGIGNEAMDAITTSHTSDTPPIPCKDAPTLAQPGRIYTPGTLPERAEEITL